MTMQAAALLDDAWALFDKCARHTSQGISRQSCSWEKPRTPYDFAALLVKSLLPLTYNYSEAHHPGVTQEIWETMMDSYEVLDLKYVNEILNRQDA